MATDTVRCTPLTKKMLTQYSELTGIKMTKLNEIAVLNLPYLPLKKKK